MLAKKRNVTDTTTLSNVDKHFQILINNNNSIGNTEKQLTKNDLPLWFDENLFKAGQKFFTNNVFAVGLGSFVGLLTVLTIPSTLDILIFTKKSGTPCMAFKRYSQTLLHIYTLYRNDITDPTGRWWKSVNVIRWKHAKGNEAAMNSGTGHISQRDMGLTQFGFIGYVLMYPEKLGVVGTQTEWEGFNHFWRVVGYLIGISDEVNICRKTISETRELCQKICKHVIIDMIENRTEICEKMILILIDGFSSVDIKMNTDSILYLWYELNGMKYDKPLSIRSRLNIAYRNTIIYLIGVPFIGSIVRNGYNYHLMFSYWILERWPIFAYMRFGKKQSKIQLYYNH